MPYLAVAVSLLAGYVYLTSSPASAESRSVNSKAWLARALNKAASTGDLKELQSLLAAHHPSEGVNLAHPSGWTPLMAASANGHTDVVRYLLSQGADVNAKDRYSVTRRNLSTELLKQRSADFHPAINPRIACVGWTPLHYAVAFQHLPIVELLLSHGADTDAKNADGDDPLNVLEWEHLEGGSEARREVERLISKEKERRLVLQRQRDKEERIKNPLELKLRASMVGQLMPIYSVASAIRRRENGWYDASKPLVFLFLGSSGVGKTMLAKTLAKEMVKGGKEGVEGEGEGFIRVDMTEFQSKHEMARLIGSPPGYVGYEEGGQLTSKLEKCPDAVVLLDEVEKAHPDVLTLMLQVFDEGRLTDGKGKTVHCPNAIFILTSNLVQEEIRDAIAQGHYTLRPDMPHALSNTRSSSTSTATSSSSSPTLSSFTPSTSTNAVPPATPNSFSGSPTSTSPSSEQKPAQPTVLDVPSTTETLVPTPPASSTSDFDPSAISLVAKSTDDFLRQQIHPILKRHFRREEFLGRINDIVVFHPLADKDLEETVETELGRWKVKAYERHGIVLEWSRRLVQSLKGGYDERYGYRSMIYTVEKRVVNVLAASHERDLIGKGSVVELDVEDEPAVGSDASHRHQKVVIRKVSQLPEGEQPEAAKRKWFGLF